MIKHIERERQREEGRKGGKKITTQREEKTTKNAFYSTFLAT